MSLSDVCYKNLAEQELKTFVLGAGTKVLDTSIYNVYTCVMKTTIQKCGNSLGVRLPKSIAEEKALKEGLGVNVVLRNNQIVIEPVEEEVTLKSMLSAISEDNVHSEADWSEAQGNEVW